jgi:dolichyl-diphosphooligosaccharide--protein glycosyltransferase
MARRARSKGSRKRTPKDRKVPKTKEVQDPKKTSDDTVKKTPQSPGKERVVQDAEKASALSEWWRQNRNTVLILLGIMFMAFFIREYFYYKISFNAWPPNIVGNDPSYHKRVIDFVQEDLHHIHVDGLLNYPVSNVNPRPPIFDWSIAIMGFVISPLFGFNVAASTWYVYQFAPTIWGVLTLIPVYLLGKEVFGRKAGLMAAFLLALTASHIERSTLGFTDHDSFIVFLVVLTLYFLSKSFSVQKERNYISDWRKPNSVILGIRSYFKENKTAQYYAALTGVTMAAISLTWEGYAYVLAILLIYYMVQLLLHRFRNEDSLGTFMVMYTAMGMVILLSLPYYYTFSIATWSQGFYIFLAMTMLGLFIVPTRDMPWLIVIPTLGVFLGASYAILSYGFPQTADLLFTGGGYFVSNKLYDTIAEAQAPEISRLVFTFGPGTFFLALVGVVMAFVKIPKNMRKDYLVIVIWTAVAIFMAMSATRFNINATPAFALLAGWALVEAVRWLKAGNLAIIYSVIGTLILLFGLGIVYEGWSGPVVGNYMLITMLGTVLVSLGLFAFMKYKRHRDWFKFRKVIAGMSVGFLIIMPNVFFAVDASIPIESKSDFDPDLDYLGSFGSSLHSEYWMDSYQWLAQQDILEDGEYVEPEDRPGFMSWWDYGFDQLLLGKHPTAADNFQNGYQFTGSMIASQNETEAISLMCMRLLEGDWAGWRHDRHRQFTDEVWDVLEDHLGSNENSSYSAEALRHIFKKSGEYIDLIEENPDVYGNYNDITVLNARYAAGRVLLTRLGEEGVVDLYEDLIDATDTSLRYFAVDYRLFPFSAQNTGIFYAPITLADRDVDDFLEYKVFAQENTRGSNEDPVWTDYPDNPISMDKAEEESERLGYKFRINGYEMYYTDMFYNSMFYKAYIGWGPDDVGAVNDGKAVPSIAGDIARMPAMQGWNMTHFKLVYRTMYYSPLEDDGNTSFPDDYEPMASKEALKLYQEKGGDIKSGLGQGTCYIKYYHGAKLHGKVRTDSGIGVPGVRVTILDDYGIPHGNVITGPNGEYELIAPPGDVTLVVSTGNLKNEYDKLYQFEVDQSTGQPMNAINTETFTISDDLAMRRIDNGELKKDLEVPGIPMSGNVYWDTDDDSSYTAGTDTLITKGSITFVHQGRETLTYGPYELDDSGRYQLNDLVVGTYDVEYDLGSKSETLISNFIIDTQATGSKDIRLDRTEVNGTVTYINGQPGANLTLNLIGQDGGITEIPVDSTGSYSIKEVFPGIYHLELDSDDYYHEPVSFSISQADSLTFNLTLIPGTDMTVRVRYPSSPATPGKIGDLAEGAVVTAYLRENSTNYWTGTTDKSGEADFFLPIGNYDIQVHSVERDTFWAYLGNTFLNWREDATIASTLQPGFRIGGTLTKLVDNPHNETEIKFIQGDNIAHAFSNRGGEYSIYLPKNDYKIIVDNRSTSNVSYFHMQDLEAPGMDNEMELDIWTPKTINVSGRAFWDKDGDGRFSGDIDPEESSTIPLEHVIDNTTILFRYDNGTISVRTDSDGAYEVELPPGDYIMEMEVPGYDFFSRELPVEDTAENVNFGLSDINAMLIARSRSVEVKAFYNYYGADGITMVPLEDFSVRQITGESHLGDQEWTHLTDENGMFFIDVEPGEYIFEGDLIYNSNGLDHSISLTEIVTIDPDEDTHILNLETDHMISVKGTMFLIENELSRYPAEMAVNLLPIKGERMTLDSVDTDFNGRFEFNVPVGDYIIEAHRDRSAAHYMYWKVVSFNDDLSETQYEMKEAISVEGDLNPSFEGIKDSVIFFEDFNGTWISTGIGSSGHLSIFLFPGDYRVVYSFETEESSTDGGYLVQYLYDENVSIPEPVYGLTFRPEKFIGLQGAVYHDINGDRSIQQDERIPFANISFIPLEKDYPPLNLSADENGDFKALVPLDRIKVEVSIEGYQSEPREDLKIFDLIDDPLAFRDIAVLPDEVRIEGILYMDSDRDDEVDDGEKGYSGMDLTFTEDDGSQYHASTASDGSFDLLLPIGNYRVFAMSYSKGLPVAGYLNELNVDMGEEQLDQEWFAVPAGRYTGSLFFKDTDGVLRYEIPGEDGKIDFYSEGRGTIMADYTGNTFRIDLPYYDYQASSVIYSEEYGMDMQYSISSSITVDENSGPQDFALEFVKNKDHSFEIDLIVDEQHEVEMGPDSTEVFDYFIENVGNEPIVVTVSSSEKPEGWITEFPEGESLELGIGEKVVRQLNITTPKEPSFTNSLIFKGESEEGTSNNFQMQVYTPPSYRFDLNFDLPDVVGVGYGERRTFNLTVDNLGSGEDVVNIQMSPKSGSVEDWTILWEGSEEFPEEGENASLTPRGQRRYAITIETPEVDLEDQRFRESLTMTFTAMNRQGDVVKEEIRFELRKPNLVLPPEYLKLSNRRLDDLVMNKTVDANITVRSIYKDASDVNVSLKIDGKVVAEGVIDYIPQGGEESVRISFNTTDSNITEDDFHTFEVVIDPYNTIKETDDYDNVGVWYNVVIGDTPSEDVEVNWRIVIFIAIVLLVTLGIIAYRQKNEPI